MKILGPYADELIAIAEKQNIRATKGDGLNEVAIGESVWMTPRAYPEPSAFANRELARLRELASAACVFVEYDPPFETKSTTRRLSYERFIIKQSDHPASSSFSPLDLLDAHNAYVQIPDAFRGSRQEIVTVARVAGFDTAVFGLPDSTLSGIVRIPELGNMMWSSTSISSPGLRRYKPISRWELLLRDILVHLSNSENTPESEAITHMENTSQNRLAPSEDIPPELDDSNRSEEYAKAICLNTDWYMKSGMLISCDGSSGVLEGLQSDIDIDGTQPAMLHNGKPNERADCNIQSAMAFLYAGATLKRADISRIGRNLLKFTIDEFQYKDKSVYSGLWKWFRSGYESTVFYADDNGWAGFFSLLYGVAEDDDNAAVAGIRTAVALRETWGANGHRRRRIDLPDFYAVGGREGLRNEAPDQQLYRSPHYESASMALMGLATLCTGDASFVQTVLPGIDDYLEKWPDEIMFQHSENDDASKFIVALLFCGAAAGDTRYVDKARAMLEPFMDAQLTCGAIPDIDRTGDRYGKNRSNADYGTFESSLFQNPTDIVTDQVYGTSFLLIAFYFAHVFQSADAEVGQATTKLADYLVRIQLRDTGRDFLDGAWMRAFDPNRWEYFGAAGDWGYGPYLMETGWCQAIIVTGLSWLVSGVMFQPEASTRTHAKLPAISFCSEEQKTRLAVAATGFTNEQAANEPCWRDYTPPAVPRKSKTDEPDVMI